MKATLLICLLASLAAYRCAGQTAAVESAKTNITANSIANSAANTATSPSNTVATVTDNAATTSTTLPLPQLTLEPAKSDLANDVVTNKHFRISGPLVRPFKAKSLREVPKRVFHAINPFAPTEETTDLKGLPRMTTQAWTTTVGWHPGASAFADPVTHESRMGLISVGRSSPP